MPQNVPVDRVRIFRRDGTSIAEFKTRVERSWALGGEGRAQFTYASRKTDIVNRDVLQYGNWVLIENDQLPAWVGVIDTPRTWTPRTVRVSIYSPEKVFEQRRGVLEVKKNGSAGALFRYLLSLVNGAETTIIKAGDIDETGIYREETINPTPLSRDLKRIQERSGEEYQWRPDTDALGRLIIYADWQPRIGIDTEALLHEGKGGGNLEAVGSLMVEDGDIYNNILGYGDGMTWATKTKFEAQDGNSVEEYGLRQTSKYFNGVSNTVTLKNNTEELLKTTKNPVIKFKLNVINVGDTFKYIQMGNTLNLQLQSMGFQNGGLGYEAVVRIVGMRYNPSSKNKIELITEVYDE